MRYGGYDPTGLYPPLDRDASIGVFFEKIKEPITCFRKLAIFFEVEAEQK